MNCDKTRPNVADISNNHFDLCKQMNNKVHILFDGLRWPIFWRAIT